MEQQLEALGLVPVVMELVLEVLVPDLGLLVQVGSAVQVLAVTALVPQVRVAMDLALLEQD